MTDTTLEAPGLRFTLLSQWQDALQTTKLLAPPVTGALRHDQIGRVRVT